MYAEEGPAFVDDYVAGGPGCIRVDGFDAVVCLEPECPVEAEGAQVYCYPIEDFSVEPLPNFHRALATLLSLAWEGLRVYVHCRAGCGRTGTLVSAYLILSKGLSHEEAVGVYRGIRGCGPESWEQHMLLKGLEILASRLGSQGALEALGRAGSLEEFMGEVYKHAGRRG
ncbi:protein-tyrosine phosphatase family protein [Stetteria hydrogenophila]